MSKDKKTNTGDLEFRQFFWKKDGLLKNNLRIVISGTVGVGKSTICESMVEEFNDVNLENNYLKEETVESVFLKLFYEDPKEWAYLAQLNWVVKRFEQWLVNEEFLKNKKNHITVYDRHFLDDYIFAEMHTAKENISSYLSLSYQVQYQEILKKMADKDKQPDYIFLLKAPLDVVLERLKGRGRASEVDANIEYWKELYDNYYIKPHFRHHFEKNCKKLVVIETENKSIQEIKNEIYDILSNEKKEKIVYLPEELRKLKRCYKRKEELEKELQEYSKYMEEAFVSPNNDGYISTAVLHANELETKICRYTEIIKEIKGEK